MNNVEKIMTEITKELTGYREWFDSLTPLDRSNFEMLINLPNGPDLIAQMANNNEGEGDYLRWAAFALGLAGRAKELSEALNRSR